MADYPLPDLTFPTALYGNSSNPMDLRVLLYKGASAENNRVVFNKIAAGELGNPIQKRIELVQRIHWELNAALISGKSQRTTENIFYMFKNFFSWAERQNITLSMESIASAFLQWSEFLFDRALKNEISKHSAYLIGLRVSKPLSAILEKSQPLITTTRLRHDARHHSIAMDEQNLGSLFKFGHLLIDIVNCLNLKDVYGVLPIKIELRNGSTWNEWSGLSDAATLKTFSPESKRVDYQRKALAWRSARESEHSVRTRSSPINFRLQAELLIFLAQTSMNLTQARQLKLTQANFKSNIDGYQVRAYKGRKGGDALFEIHSEYRDHFEKYLAWRKAIFKETSELLFPFVSKGGSFTPLATFISYEKIKSICKAENIKFYGPQELRKAKINWFYRQSFDPALTVEHAQNTIEVLYRNYLRPSLQATKIEFIQYWSKRDPTLQQDKIGPAPAPGICDGIPTSIAKISPEAPRPDCIHPSGCLFCEHHRDIDSEDYVWSVASMKYFYSILITKYRPIEKNKLDMGSHIELALEILVQKLKQLKSLNEKRNKWVKESLERCNEEDFHPHWDYLIRSIEV